MTTHDFGHGPVPAVIGGSAWIGSGDGERG
jgi:hypothetical protein